MDSTIDLSISPEQISHIEMNLNLSIDERIDQLQSAVSLIEEMKSALADSDEN